MKGTLFFLFFGILFTQAATSYSQGVELTLNLKSASIKEICGEIEKQSEFRFIFAGNAKKIINKKVGLTTNSQNIINILDNILTTTDLIYKILDNQIVVYRNETKENSKQLKEIVSELLVQQQKKQITGTVVDEEGVPIIGANIIESGTTNGTITDVNGNFILEIANDVIIRISYIGYHEQEISTAGKTTFNIELQEDTKALEEIVVVGFGTQKRANLTGAVSTVDTKALADRQTSDLNQSLQGVSPGLSLVYSSGQLNDSPSINIRGIGTLIDGEMGGGPLILVDGIPTELSMVNPNDVESISILKDAASASIYGARAAFGVVIITTKEGKNTDKMNFSYSSSFGFSNPTKLIKHMNPIDELTAIISAADARGEESESWGAYHKQTLIGVERWYENYADKRDPLDLNMVYGEDFENVNGTTYFYRVWDVERLMFGRNVPNSTHSLNMSGKLGKNSSIMTSIGYTNRKGVMRDNPENLDRYNFTLNLNSKITDWLDSDIRVMLSRQDYEEPYNYMSSAGYSGFGNNGYFGHIYRYGAYAPYGTFKGIGFGFAPSYLRSAEKGLKRTDYLRLTARLQANITENLSLTTEYSIGQSYINWKLNGGVLNLWRYQGAMVDPDGEPVPQGATPGSAGDAVKFSNSSESTNVMNAYLKYDKTIKEDHSIDLQIGINTEWSEFQRNYSARHSLVDPSRHEIDLATGTQYSTTAAYQMAPAHSHYSIGGIFARINYDYQGKYLAEFNTRYDGSSKFPKNSQWGIFPSGSIGWRVSEEAFMKGTKDVIDNLKIRLSLGTIGNQRIRPNAFESVMTTANAYWIGNNSTTQNLTYTLPSTTSEYLTWEKVNTFNIGVDLSLFRLFDLSADWFQRETKGMLAPGEALPHVFGDTAPLTNAGNLRTRGYEIILNYNKTINKNTSIYASVSFSDSKSVVTSWNSAGVIDEIYQGKIIGEIWGLTSDRLLQIDDFNNGQMLDKHPDQSQLERGDFKFGPGDMLYKDIDGDRVITGGKGTIDDHGDLKRIGNSLPRYEYNFRLGGETHNFDFSVFFQGVGKRSLSGGGSDVFMPFQRGYYDVLYAHQSDFWTPDNTDAYYPRLWRYYGASNAFTGVYGSNNSIVQTRYLLNLSYLRLKNMTIGYTIPKTITQKANINKLRFYLTGENLFTIQDKMLPVDPEVTQTEHMLGRSFPLQKTYAFGVQINF